MLVSTVNRASYRYTSCLHNFPHNNIVRCSKDHMALQECVIIGTCTSFSSVQPQFKGVFCSQSSPELEDKLSCYEISVFSPAVMMSSVLSFINYFPISDNFALFINVLTAVGFAVPNGLDFVSHPVIACKNSSECLKSPIAVVKCFMFRVLFPFDLSE